MTTRSFFLAAQFWFLGQAFLLSAAPLRVATWDMQPRVAAGTNGWSANFQHTLIQEASESLKKSRPDVILLQHVADWQTCRQLAQDLQPENYQVVTCSSWRDPLGKNLHGQTAILSKTKAYLSWSEPWQSKSAPATGGFAFAAIQAGDKTIGILSVQQGADDASQKTQLASQISSLQNWKANRPQAYVLALDASTVPDGLHLEQIGFENAWATVPQDKRAASECLFTRDMGLISAPLIVQMAHFEHDALTCEMDLTASKVVTSPALAKPVTTPVIHSEVGVVPANTSKPAGDFRALLWLASCLAGGLSVFFLIRKTLRTTVGRPYENAAHVPIKIEGSTPAQSPAWRSPPVVGFGTSPMTAEVRAGVIASVSHWLKQKVVRQLVSDRAQLLATQKVAALRMREVDERLAKVEHHIQQRNQDYERRIDDLLKALITAKEENRTLIRAQIAHLKAEIEKAEHKPGQRGNENEQWSGPE